MTNKEILQADMLDILFEHRNKLYGAYALRKTYDRRLGKSLGLALGIALAFICFSFIKAKKSSNGVRIESGAFVMTDVNLEKQKVEEEVRPKEKPQKATADYNKIVVVPDDKADKDLPDIIKVSESIIGNENTDGEIDDGSTSQVSRDDGNGSGQTVVKEPEVINEPEQITRGPEFPGGEAAWISFLRRYLQAPEDLEPGQRIEVVVQFWVDVDGSVSRTSVMKSGGSSFDKEVLRVIKKMPKWMPALQHGNPVAVPYSQPVTFMGLEQ